LGLGAFDGRTVAEVEITMPDTYIINYCAMIESSCFPACNCKLTYGWSC
jgi:hypothetical protein